MIPPLGMLAASAFEGAEVPARSISARSPTSREGQFIITTFVEDPARGRGLRRTAYIRYNGLLGNQPSFTILSNRCAHLGCPVQPNGPVDAKPVDEPRRTGPGSEVLKKTPAQPAGFGCPCHGGQYDTEGNRIAGPPVRALDRYTYSIVDGHLVLGSAYSVDYVKGTGKDGADQEVPAAQPGPARRRPRVLALARSRRSGP